jgi:hypothetical protein
MSDKPELTALQLWILRAQREILLKGSVRHEGPAREPEPSTTREEPPVQVGK